MMNKIPDNSSAERLNRLLNRNLGTNFAQIKSGDKPAKVVSNDAIITELDDEALNPTSPTTIKHQQIAAQGGIAPVTIYGRSQPTLNQRALKRKQLNEARKQQNIESIMAQAMEYCSKSSATEDIDPDWFHQFIQLSEDISSKLMQALWGKILAGEITKPGTFSLKSLTILKRMTNKEAIAFQHACQLAMTNRKDNSNQIIYGFYQKPRMFNFFTLTKKHKINLSKFQLPYPELLTLMDIELIYHTEIESGALDQGEFIEFNHLGCNVKFTAKKNSTVLNYYKFTQTGCELAKLIRLSPSKPYLNEITQTFQGTFDVE